MSLARITVTVPPALVRTADRIARHGGTSRSSVVTEALRLYLQTQPSRTANQPGRVAESPVAEYEVLANVTDDALIGELSRRLAGSTTSRGTSSSQGLAHVALDHARLAQLCRQFNIRRLALFGSVLRDDFGPDSDVDVLVQFEPGQTPGLAVQDIEDQLSALLGGRRVDLVTEQSLHPLIRDKVLSSAVVQYAA